LSCSMTMRITRVIPIVLVVACASSGGSSAGSRSSPDLITRAEINSSNASNAYELIDRLRPNWLRPTATGSISGGAQSQIILVYLDRQRMEDLRGLRTITAASIQSAQWIDAARAPTILPDVPSGAIAGAIVIRTH
jgi:hypothetical protein